MSLSHSDGGAMISAAELLDDFDAFLRKVGFYASADYLLNMAFGQRMDVLLLLYRDYMNDICFLPTLLDKLEAALNDGNLTTLPGKLYLIEEYLIPTMEFKVSRNDITVSYLLSFMDKLVASRLCNKQLLYSIFKRCSSDVLALDILKRFRSATGNIILTADVNKMLTSTTQRQASHPQAQAHTECNRYKGLAAASTIEDFNLYLTVKDGESDIDSSVDNLINECFKRGLLLGFRSLVCHHGRNPADFLLAQTSYSAASLTIVRWLIEEFYFDRHDYMKFAGLSLPHLTIDNGNGINGVSNSNSSNNNNNSSSKEIVDLCLNKAQASRSDIVWLFFNTDNNQSRSNLLRCGYITIAELEAGAVSSKDKNIVLLEKYRMDVMSDYVAACQPAVMAVTLSSTPAAACSVEQDALVNNSLLTHRVSLSTEEVVADSKSVTAANHYTDDDTSSSETNSDHSSYEEVEYKSDDDDSDEDELVRQPRSIFTAAKMTR